MFASKCSIIFILTTFSWMATSGIVMTCSLSTLLFLVLGRRWGCFVDVISPRVRSSNVLNYPVCSVVQKDQVYSTERHDFLVTALNVYGECSPDVTLIKYSHMHSMFS